MAKSVATLLAEVATNIPDNTVGAITPAIVRTTLDDIINSYFNTVDLVPVASASQFGLVKVDGTTITAAGGVISSVGGGGGGGVITPAAVRIAPFSNTNAHSGTDYFATFDITSYIIPQTDGVTGYLSSVYGNVNPGFGSNLMVCNWNQGSQTGQDQNGQKSTQINQNVTSTWSGAGQHLLHNWKADCFGMSDSFIMSAVLNYSGGPIGGDEGQSWCSNEVGVFQQAFLVTATIDQVLNTSCTVNTTTTQPVSGSQNVQKIYVASLTGVAAGDWVILNQTLPVFAPSIWPVNVTSTGTDITGNFITGICLNNFSSGVTVTPATVFTLDNKGFQVGQDRVLINLSAPSYSVGTASQQGPVGSSPQLVGTGTSWANNIVGGNAKNIGAISFDSDDYINLPFYSGGQLVRSKTTHNITTGALNFAIISANYPFTATPPATQVIIYDSTNHKNSMWGTVTAYGLVGGVPTLTINVVGSTGSGSSLSDWSIYQAVITTSATAFTIPTTFPSGSIVQNFTVPAGLPFVNNNLVTVYETSNVANSVSGTIDNYSGTTLTVRIGSSTGSGAGITDWTIAAQAISTSTGTLKSWYQINAGNDGSSPISAGALNINVNSAPVTIGYQGLAPIAPASGGYIIRPACRVLLNLGNFANPQGMQICETTTAKWNVGDRVECAICPYSDVSGFKFRFAHYNPGASLRSMLSLLNAGARTVFSGIEIGGWGGSEIGQFGADAVAMDQGVSISSANSGIVYEPAAAATGFAFDIDINQNTNDVSNRINWGGAFGGAFMGYNTANAGLQAQWASSAASGPAIISAYSAATTNNPNPRLSEAEFDTYWMRLTGVNGVSDSFLEFGLKGDYADGAGKGRIQLHSALSIRGAINQLAGMDFNFVSGPIASEVTTGLFSISGASNFPIVRPTNAALTTYSNTPVGGGNWPCSGWPAILPALNVSNTTNTGSSILELLTSVWTGSTVFTKPVLIAAIPNQGVNDASISLSVQMLSPGAPGSIDITKPRTVMSIDENGILYIGVNDPLNSAFQGATISPANISPAAAVSTGVLALTLPNQAGGIGVIKEVTSDPATGASTVNIGGATINSNTGVVCIYSPTANKWARFTPGSFT